MKALGKVLLVLVSTTGVLVAAETGCRVAAYLEDLETLDDINQAIVPPLPGEPVTVGKLLRVSSNPRIIFELIPNISPVHRGQTVNINENGFRGPVIELEKRPATKRVVGIGDSVMFGWGVKDDEGYLEVLGTLLRERNERCQWEFVNTAVPGYNTVMEVETLREKGLAYQPDLVMIHYVPNDLQLPNFIRAQEDFYSLRESFLAKYLRGTLKRVAIARAPRGDDADAFESVPHRVPPQYQDMVGEDAYRRAMEGLYELSQRHGFDVLVLANRFPDFVQAVSRGLGFAMLEILPDWKEYAASHGLDEIADRRLTRTDPHPAPIAHHVIASSLFDYLRQHYPDCD